MPVSKKIIEDVKRGSWIRKMFEEGLRLKKEFGPDNVFDMSLGNPDLEPPEAFVSALRNFVNSDIAGRHRYMPNVGYPETRAAIAKMLSSGGSTPVSATDVVMTCGAAGGLNVALKALLNAGDEVVLLAPYFVEYTYYAENHGLKCVIADTDENFLPDIKSLDEKINRHTAAIIINSPNNPTGVVYKEQTIKAMAELLREKEKKLGRKVLLILDDAYGKLCYDGAKTPSIFDHYDESVIVASFSKTLSVPGERIGYIAVSPKCSDHDDAMSALAFCNRTLGFVNAPAIMQNVISVAADSLVDVGVYKKKRDYLYENLVKIGYDVVKPEGAFYFFPKTPLKDDVEFVQKLLEWRVLAVPGSGFGSAGHMRLSYCVSDRVIEGAIDGLRKAFIK